MNKIVILGGSPAGIKVIEHIREQDKVSEIILIALDGHYPYNRDAFDAFIAKEIPFDGVFCRSKKFYDENKVSVFLDKKITRINVKHKKIFTEDKTQIDYNFLIVTDTPENRFPQIKGTNKSGIYGYKKLRDIELLVKELPFIETCAIQSDTFTGLRVAAALAKRGKDVMLFTSGKDFFSQHFDAEVTDWLVEQWSQNGLRIMRGNLISEILGDKAVKAVRLSTGKVFSAEGILFVECDEDMRLFSDLNIQMEVKFHVNEQFQTNVDGLFALGHVCYGALTESVQASMILEAQGIKVGEVITGRNVGDSFLPPATTEFSLADNLVTVIGDISTGPDTEVHRSFNLEEHQYVRLYLVEGCCVGAVLVNGRERKAEIIQMISEKSNIEKGMEEMPPVQTVEIDKSLNVEPTVEVVDQP